MSFLSIRGLARDSLQQDEGDAARNVQVVSHSLSRNPSLTEPPVEDDDGVIIAAELG